MTEKALERPYFECHVTLMPEHEKAVTPVAKKHGFKTSRIDGDPLLGDKVYFYCTASGLQYDSLLERMNSLVADLPVPHLRRKIESVVLDIRV